jgi:hypothetical protein
MCVKVHGAVLADGSPDFEKRAAMECFCAQMLAEVMVEECVRYVAECKYAGDTANAGDGGSADVTGAAIPRAALATFFRSFSLSAVPVSTHAVSLSAVQVSTHAGLKLHVDKLLPKLHALIPVETAAWRKVKFPTFSTVDRRTTEATLHKSLNISEDEMWKMCYSNPAAYNLKGYVALRYLVL